MPHAIYVDNTAKFFSATSSLIRHIDHWRWAVLPLYKSDNLNRPAHVGSGTLISHRGRKFLVTALHVLTTIGPDGTADTFVPETRRGEMVNLTGNYKVSKIDDVCAWEITGRDVVGHFIPLDSVYRLPPHIGDAHIITGFPESNNRRRNGEVSINYFSLISNISATRNMKTFCLSCSPRKIYDTHGRKCTMPNPQGISGGAVWRVLPGRQLRLAGIGVTDQSGLSSFFVSGKPRFEAVSGAVIHKLVSSFF